MPGIRIHRQGMADKSPFRLKFRRWLFIRSANRETFRDVCLVDIVAHPFAENLCSFLSIHGPYLCYQGCSHKMRTIANERAVLVAS